MTMIVMAIITSTSVKADGRVFWLRLKPERLNGVRFIGQERDNWQWCSYRPVV